MDPPCATPAPTPPGRTAKPACGGATVWPARRLHIESTLFGILNGTATPTAVLGEDLSGSSPDGSAFNTHGTLLVLCTARLTRDTPVRDVPEGESSSNNFLLQISFWIADPVLCMSASETSRCFTLSLWSLFWVSCLWFRLVTREPFRLQCAKTQGTLSARRLTPKRDQETAADGGTSTRGP